MKEKKDFFDFKNISKKMKKLPLFVTSNTIPLTPKYIFLS
jgi:hypothetical protein